MTIPTRVTLRSGERIFINGAVLAWDGRGSFEILNDVPYLLEHEIMHAQQALTPLRQLYYILQTMILEPGGMTDADNVYREAMDGLKTAFSNEDVLIGLAVIQRLVAEGNPFAALNVLRGLVPIEDQILGRNAQPELRVVEGRS